MSNLPLKNSHVKGPGALTTQAQLILDYLSEVKENGQRRTLTPMIAMVSLGVGSLTARITEIRRAGNEISDEWDKDHFGRRYKTYWIGEARPDYSEGEVKDADQSDPS